MTYREAMDIVAKVTFRDWKFTVEDNIGDGRYLQVSFMEGGELQKGRKWKLSEHMTPSELVQTAFKAVLTATEHETREFFKYKNYPIFSPHYDIEALVALCSGWKFEVRPPPPPEDVNYSI